VIRVMLHLDVPEEARARLEQLCAGNAEVQLMTPDGTFSGYVAGDDSVLDEARVMLPAYLQGNGYTGAAGSQELAAYWLMTAAERARRARLR